MFYQNSDKLKLNVRNVFNSEKESGGEKGVKIMIMFRNVIFQPIMFRNVMVSSRPSTWLRSKSSDEPSPQESENHHSSSSSSSSS